MEVHPEIIFPPISQSHIGAGVTHLLPQRGRMRVPVRVFASPRLFPSEDEIIGLERIASLEGVAQVVALPDLHVKPRLETPSSTAVAIRDRVALSLSSPSAGCGMALAITPLGLDDLDTPHLDALFANLAQHLPTRRDPSSAMIEDIRPVLLHGASAAVRHFNLDPRVLDGIECRGNALDMLAPQLEPDEILNAVPEQFFSLAAQEFGSVGRGNHFLELQVVEEVLSTPEAERWGLRAGQVVVMYHADSGRLGSLVGRLYAFRSKNTWRGRFLEMRYKTAYHLSQAHSLQEAYRRGTAYFLPRRHVLLEASSPEGSRALLGQAVSTNYAFGNRVAILAALTDGLKKIWGSGARTPALLYDVTHNSIRPENVDGEQLWVHRHNTSRALPAGHPALAGSPFFETGQPLLLPGTHRNHSYLCVASSGVEQSLYSVDHGAGRSAQRLRGAGPDKASVTRVYDFSRGWVGDQAHWSDDGLDEVLNVLRQANLALPVARLRPLAVLKDLPG